MDTMRDLGACNACYAGNCGFLKVRADRYYGAGIYEMEFNFLNIGQ